MMGEVQVSAAAWQAAFDKRYRKWIEEALAFAGRRLGFLRGGERVLGFPCRAKHIWRWR